MNRKLWLAACAVGLVTYACTPLDEGGGGGGGGPVTFQQGFVFVRGEDIYVVDKSNDYGHTPSKLTTSGGNRQPSLSLDGKQVVYVHSDTVSGFQVQAVATNGSGVPRTLYTSDGTQKNFRSPVFSPDGTRVVFSFDKGSGTNSQLALVNSDGTGFTELTSATASYAAPSFYPDGSGVLAIFGSSQSSYTQIQKVGIPSGNTTNVVSSLDPQVLSIANRAVLSPDGTRVAFDARLVANSSATRIFVMNVATGATNKLTEYPGDPQALDGFPTWVSNSEVAFSSNTGGADQVYILPSNSVETSGGLKVPSAMQPWFGGTSTPTS